MTLPVTFAGLTAANGFFLDQNFAALGALTAIPCTASGTNAITLTPGANTPTIAAYANYQPFTFVAVATNTGAVTIAVGALAALSVYKDTAGGPRALTGKEITSGNVVCVIYDSALAGGTGGFHLVSVPVSPVISNTVTITNNAGTTISAAQITGSGTGTALILRQGTAGGPFNDQTDSASAIVNAIAGSVVNTKFEFRVINTTGDTQTITAGSGVTVNATNKTTATGATHDFWGIITNTGTPAVTIYG